MIKKNKLTIIKSSEEYFFNEFNLAQNKTGINLEEDLKVYILKILVDRLNNKIDLDLNKPLAILYLEALKEPQNQCVKKLKCIADHTLYIAGYFSESLNKKLIDTKYYYDLSRNAYKELYNILDENIYIKIYNNYNNLVDILIELSFHTMHTSSKNLIKLYDRWIETGSQVLEQKLNEKGIITTYKKIKIA